MSLSQNADIVTAAARAPVGHVQLTSLSSAVGFTAAQIPSRAVRALIQADTQNVRWRDDGVSPTTGVGMILYAGAAPLEYTGDLTAIKFIEVSATAKLNVAFYE